MRSAFTLVELMVVLLVMSIVAGALTLSLTSPSKRADMDDVVAGIVQFDLLARQHALRHGQARQLVFDLDAHKIGELSEEDRDDSPARIFALPEGYRLATLTLASGSINSGRTAVWCSDRGYTPTYALRVEGPAGRRWVLFAGLTGEVIQTEDEKEIEQSMALLSAEGADAD